MFNGLPRVGIALLVIIALLLLFALRSVFLPVKAVVLVVLSLGASLGTLLLLVTTRPGAALIGASGPEDIHPIVPITIVAITVALSTDYEVILISRIAEHYRRTGDNRGAVVSGIEHTGSVITSAAAIMIGVFAGFALAGKSNETRSRGTALRSRRRLPRRRPVAVGGTNPAPAAFTMPLTSSRPSSWSKSGRSRRLTSTRSTTCQRTCLRPRPLRCARRCRSHCAD